MPIIQFINPSRDSAKVSTHSRIVLQEIMTAAGISQVTITSTARTAADQARIMYENITRHGVAHQKRLYGSYGDKIIDEYDLLERKGKTKAEIVAGMTQKIISVGPRNVSRHAGDPSALNVVDIALSSIGLARKQQFENAVKADSRVSKFLTPPKDPAYHLEIPQP
ncbi:hypothetical protein CWC31_12340 [Pseudoalteromonas ruthenica]|nr:hypothetical protein CWC31_12340 [Pseudoalteromonas ruthenica]